MNGALKTLVTGGTGVVGGALVPHLLRERPDDLVLLVRAGKTGDAQNRLEGMLDDWKRLPDWKPGSEQRLTCVAGDISQPLLGLDPRVREDLVPCLAGIVHAAANVKMTLPLEEARAISCGSMREILSLADQARQRRGVPPKLDYVSTMGVAGRQQGRIPEAELAEPRLFHNTYEQAKAEAETVLLNAMRQGQPATIYRPSMITGDSRTGQTTHFQIFHYLCDFLSGRHTRGWLPAIRGFSLDLIPVDTVAAAVAKGGSQPDSIGKILHLTSGESAPVMPEDLGERMRVLLADAEVAVPRARRVPAPVFMATLRIIKPFLPNAMQRRLAFLPVALSYMKDRQIFENTVSRAWLEALGIPWPHPRDYVDASLRYYIAQRLSSAA